MDLFELQATLRLNTSQYNRSLHQAESDGEGFVDRIADKWTSLKSKFQTVANVLGPVVDLVKDAVGNFAEFQQLSGSIETLFGSAASGVIQKSKEAWRTAGISMNDYLNQVTSVAARMIEELGGNTEEAARLADMAIQDMSDNANTFGTDLSSIQNAYSGFSRGVYTMLDNLKLGYSGTASEMYRLLEDAAELDEEFANSAVFSMDGNGHLNARYADIVKAINIIQRSKGIQGRSAEESQSTVQGSLTSMKALWENLKTLMATPLEVREGETREEAEARRQHEIQEMAQNMASALEGVLRNIMPVIKQAILGLIQIFTELIPEVVKIIPPLIKGIIEALPEIITALADGLKQLLENQELRDSLVEAVRVLMDTITQIIGDQEMWNALLGLVKSLVGAVVNVLPQFTSTIVNFLVGLLRDPSFIVELVKVLAYAVVSAFAGLADAMLTMLFTLFNPNYTKTGTAFEKMGVYDWLQSVFGFEDEGRSGMRMNRYHREMTPEEQAQVDAQNEELEASTAYTFEQMAEAYKAAFGDGAYANFANGQYSFGRNGEAGQTFGNSGAAIAAMMAALAANGYSVEELLAQAQEQAQGHASQTWSHGGVTYDVPEGDTAAQWENFIRGLEHVYGAELEEDQIRYLIEQYGGHLSEDLNAENLNITSPGAEVNARSVTFNGNLTIGYGTVLEALNGYDGSHATGLMDVPYDNYLANLHRDEMVLTASQARDYREGNGGGLDTDALYAAVSAAVAEAVSNIQVNMDGTLVGNAVAETVSRNIYREAARRY